MDRAGECWRILRSARVRTAKGHGSVRAVANRSKSSSTYAGTAESPRGQAPLVVAAEQPDEAEEDDKTDAADETVGESPSDDVPLQRRCGALGPKIIVVLSFMWIARFLVRSMIRIAPRWDTDLFLLSTVCGTSSIWRSFGVTLLVIRRSGEPWSKFGLRKFQPGTDRPGAIAFLLVLGVYLVGSDALRAVLDLFYTPYEVRQLLAHHTRIVHPVDGIEAAMGVITMICVSFTEELVMRGYLIPRMEQLLRWTWCGVLVSAGVFAYGHLYQGIGGPGRLSGSASFLASCLCIPGGYGRSWGLMR